MSICSHSSIDMLTAVYVYMDTPCVIVVQKTRNAAKGKCGGVDELKGRKGDIYWASLDGMSETPQVKAPW